MTTTTQHLLGRLAGIARSVTDPTASQRSAPAPASPGWPGLYLGVGRTGYVWAGPEHHALIIGPPRSGKTTRLVVPNLAQHPGPAVATSTKTDLAAATIATRARRGRCWWWDPSATTPAPAGTQPLAWSPLVGCASWDQTVARTHALAAAARPQPGVHETHWVERAQALLAPLLHAAALHHDDMVAVLGWLHRHDLVAPTAILRHHHAERAADYLDGLGRTDGRELSGIFSTADSLLAAYRTDAALTAASHPTFDPDTFAASTDTLYLCAPAAAQAVHAPLVVALLDQIRTATYRHHPYPAMLFALDEVAHIAPLPDLAATVAEGGSQGLLVLASLQDLSQARQRWGPAADGFLTLFIHTVLLPGVADTATLKAVSALAGDIDVTVRSTTRGGHPSTTTSTQRRPRLPVAAVAAGRPGEALLITAGRLARVHI